MDQGPFLRHAFDLETDSQFLEREFHSRSEMKPWNFLEQDQCLKTQSDEFLEDESSFNSKHCINKLKNDTGPLHPILSLYAKKKPKQDLHASKMLVRRKLMPVDTKRTKGYPRNVVKMAKKSLTKKNLQDINLPKGHEHQEMILPRPDLSIMVQPSKIDYVGRKNNGGVRLFIHRPFTTPTDPFKEMNVDNNVEAFINLEYEDMYEISNEFKTNTRCIRYITQGHLWHNYSIEIADEETYTWDSCVHEWQAKTMMRICKCLPHYYSELFDYWYNANLRCNHHGLKCMAIVNGKFLHCQR